MNSRFRIFKLCEVCGALGRDPPLRLPGGGGAEVERGGHQLGPLWCVHDGRVRGCGAVPFGRAQQLCVCRERNSNFLL